MYFGGEQGSVGFYIKPTNVGPYMKVMKEETFSHGIYHADKKPSDYIRSGCNRAIESAHKFKAGTVWVNSGPYPEANVPFGGYKQSGFGTELGQYALDEYVMIS